MYSDGVRYRWRFTIAYIKGLKDEYSDKRSIDLESFISYDEWVYSNSKLI